MLKEFIKTQEEAHNAILGTIIADGSLCKARKKSYINKCYLEITHTNKNLDYLSQYVGSIAFRVVADMQIKQLLELTGPLVTSSANQPGKPVSNNIDQAVTYFGDSIDFYLDMGNLANREPSTIIKIENDKIIVLRDGAVKI